MLNRSYPIEAAELYWDIVSAFTLSFSELCMFEKYY